MWSRFEGSKLQLENKGREDGRAPQHEEVTLHARMKGWQLTTLFFVENKYLNL
jgi:hypothetical protein